MISPNLAVIFFLLILGYLLRCNRNFPENTWLTLNMVIIHISLPALIFIRIPELSFNSDVYIPVVTAWGTLIIGVIFVCFSHMIFKWNRPTLACLLLLIPLGNTSFVGIPLIEAFLGEKHIAYAVLYDQLGSFLILSTYGSFILSIFDSDSAFNWKVTGKKLITFPPFLALLLAISLKDQVLPEWIMRLLGMLAGTLTPLALLAVGFQFQLKMPAENLRPFFFGLAGKLLFIPIIVLAVFRLFDISGSASETSLMEAAMPSMITAGCLASSAGFNPALVSSLLAWGILICPLTLTLLSTYL